MEDLTNPTPLAVVDNRVLNAVVLGYSTRIDIAARCELPSKMVEKSLRRLKRAERVRTFGSPNWYATEKGDVMRLLIEGGQGSGKTRMLDNLHKLGYVVGPEESLGEHTPTIAVTVRAPQELR